MDIDIDNLTIKQINEIASHLGISKNEANHGLTKVYGERQPVIVRAKDAGVHFGNLVAYEGRTVWLEYSRRLWKWSAKKGIALSGVAIYGLNEDGTKLDVEEDITMTVGELKKALEGIDDHLEVKFEAPVGFRIEDPLDIDIAELKQPDMDDRWIAFFCLA
ncbi:unnamed protein product [Sphagnum tenellum]